MDERQFIQQKQESWKRLSESIDAVRKGGASSLDREHLRAFGAQYRAVVSDLSFARTQGASEDLILYLNELAGRAHGVLYASRSAKLSGAVAFVTKDFPALFRSTFRYTLIAALIFFLGAAGGVYVTLVDPSMTQEWTTPVIADPAGASSFIMTNNIKVGIMAFAAGITAGLLTVFLLLYNGAHLGAVAAAMPALKRITLWTFVAPHGVIELTAIFICGGAGLIIGSSMIAPGNLRRADAMKLASDKAVRLFAGTLPMFVIAGVIEGFISPSVLDRWAKFAFSGFTAIGLIFYLGFAGRDVDKQKKSA